jgi:hypothetical protein
MNHEREKTIENRTQVPGGRGLSSLSQVALASSLHLRGVSELPELR